MLSTKLKRFFNRSISWVSLHPGLKGMELWFGQFGAVIYKEQSYWELNKTYKNEGSDTGITSLLLS
jgi:hypothetical protein